MSHKKDKNSYINPEESLSKRKYFTFFLTFLYKNQINHEAQNNVTLKFTFRVDICMSNTQHVLLPFKNNLP